MAYFANLNSENIVTHVEIVNDSHITPGDDAANEAWCLANLTSVDGGVSWKQTFKDGTRGLYANGDNIIYRTSDWEGHTTANKFVSNIPQAWASIMKLNEQNYFVPIIADPTVDDQGRTLPYPDPANLPEDALSWGFDPDNNRWQGARVIDETNDQKYYDANTQTWSNI
jgi:hypothetical protein|tara:strand:- start:454 stop:960 length:507 start_codon:yes stop_codon:yes gene_type:complete